MRELRKLGGLQPSAAQRRKQEALVREYVARADADPALDLWGRFLRMMVSEVAAGGDASILQKALAQADEHPVTQAAERWLERVGFDKPYFRLLNRPAGMGPRQPRILLAKHCKGAVAVGPDGRTVAVADGNRVAIYDAVDGTLRKTFKTKHPEKLYRLVFHPDGRRLITGRGQGDSEVGIYDLETGKRVRALGGFGDNQDFALTSDGKYVLGRDESLRFWTVDGKTRKPLWVTAEGQGEYVPLLHPNGREAVGLLGDIKFYSLEDGTLTRTIPMKVRDPEILEGPDLHALILPDGKRALFVFADPNPVIQVFDLDTGMHTRTLEGHSRPVNDLVLSPNGKCFATAAGDGYVRVWDAQSLECIWAEHAHHGAAWGVAFLSNESVVSTGDDGIGRIWDIHEGGPPPRTADPADNVLIMQPMPDGKHVLALHDDGVLREWEIATAKCTRRFDASKIPNDARLRLWIAPDGYLALLTRDGMEMRHLPMEACVFRFNLITGESGLFYTCDDEMVMGPGAIVDGALYVALSKGGLFRIALSAAGDIDLATAEKVSKERLSPYEVVANRWLLGYAGTNSFSVVDIQQPSVNKSILRNDWPFLFETRSDYAKGDQTLVAVASSDTKAIVIALPSGNIIHRFGSASAPTSKISPSGVAFAPDGRTVYTGSPSSELVAWNMETGASHSWPLPDSPIHAIYCRASLGNGVVVQSSSSITVFDTLEGEIVARWGYSLGSSLYRRTTIIDQGVLAMWVDQHLLFLSIRP